MKLTDNIKAAAQAPRERRRRRQFVRSLEEAAARAIVTATVTFAVGLVLKKMFENSVAKAAEEGAKSGVDDQLASEPATVP